MMSAILKKPGSESSEPDYRKNGTAVEIEVATEIMMGYVGHLTTEIMKEEAQPKPNQEKIEAMQFQHDLVFKECKDVITDRKLVTKALYVYGPIMKALIKSA